MLISSCNRILLLTFFLFVALSGNAQKGYSTLRPEARELALTISEAYRAPIELIQSVMEEALYLQQYQNVPASVVMGVALLESGGFKSQLFLQANNPFGIKASAPWQGDVYSVWHDSGWSHFRSYQNEREAIRDFGSFVSSRRWFADAFQCAAGDFNCFIHGLEPTDSQPGYSTDPQWGLKVRNVILRYNLDQLALLNGY